MLFRKYKIHALKMTGLEGIFAVIYMVIALVILNLIPCEESWCDYGKVINSVVSFDIIFHTPLIFSLLFGFLVFCTGYKLSSIYLVKYSTATN